MDVGERSLGLGSRRNIVGLPPIQTSITDATRKSRWTRSRSSVEPSIHSDGLAPSTTSSATTLRPRLSRMSLFNMFSRPKVEKMHGYAEPDLPIVHEPSPPPQPTERLRQQIATKSDAVSRTVPLYHTPRPDIVPVCLRPPSRHQPPSSNRSSRSQRQAPYSAPTRLRDWDPPPLFQAYPQSTKHAMLQASNLSADMILRGHGHTTRKQHSLIQGMMGSMVDVSRVVTEGTDVWRVERNQRRLSSQSVRSIESTLHVEVVEKIYCLVTSGFVLQYNSDGPSDRLPEKVLQLGTDSAAFASDLVPGKPFVLQISQTADIEGTKSVNLQSSLLSRLVHRNAAARRMTSSFLLILESTEELDSWMIAVRQEIEALGGKRVRPELSARQKADELARTEKTLRERPSHRYLVRRDPSRISVIAAFKDTPVPSPEMSTLDWDKSPNSVERNQGDASSSASTYSSRYSSIRGSADTTPTTVTSSDQQHISHQRYGARTSHIATSRPGPPEPPRSSSPIPSPSSDGFGEAKHDSVRDPTSLRSSYRRNPSSSSSVRRRSTQALPTTREGTSSPVDTGPLRTHRHSAFTTVTRGTTPRSPSPTPPAGTRKQQAFPNRTAVPDPPFGARSHSSPVKASTPSIISDDTATSARPQSIVGALPDRKSLSPRDVNRRPFPLPVRPTSVARQPGTRTSESLTPRRYSSLPPSLPLKVNPSVSSSPGSSTSTATTTPPPPSHAPDLSAWPTPTPSPPTPQPTHPLRRPASMRVHSSHSPTPLLLSTRSTSNPTSTPTSGLASRSSSNLLALSSAKQRTSTRFPIRMSLPVTAAAWLPPPAPPPSAPLPSVPLRSARRGVGVA